MELRKKRLQACCCEIEHTNTACCIRHISINCLAGRGWQAAAGCSRLQQAFQSTFHICFSPPLLQNFKVDLGNTRNIMESAAGQAVATSRGGLQTDPDRDAAG